MSMVMISGEMDQQDKEIRQQEKIKLQSVEKMTVKTGRPACHESWMAGSIRKRTVGRKY